MDDNIKLVNLIGQAGTGKTLLSLAVGLHKVLHEKVYSKIVIARPVVTLAKSHDLGFLPGDLIQKSLYLFGPVSDSLEVLMGCDEEQDFDKSKYGNSHMQWLLETNKMEICPLAYIRGRNLQNCFIIADESQNLLNFEHKAIITRLGSGSKIILAGDPAQSDHVYCDRKNNSLNYVAEKFKPYDVAAHAVLTRCERSTLSGIAAEIL